MPLLSQFLIYLFYQHTYYNLLKQFGREDIPNSCISLSDSDFENVIIFMQKKINKISSWQKSFQTTIQFITTSISILHLFLCNIGNDHSYTSTQSCHLSSQLHTNHVIYGDLPHYTQMNNLLTFDRI